MPLPSPPLMVITDRRLAVDPLPELADRLFAAGVRWLSLRDKDLPAGERLGLAKALAARALRWNAIVTMHGEPELARMAGLSGVHLGAGSDPARARALLGPAALVGLSCHDSDQGVLPASEQLMVDYLSVSPVFPSASKPGYGPTLGGEGLRRWAAGGIPVLGLGGIDEAEAATACMAVGAAGVAVMGLAMRRPEALTPLLRAVAEAGGTGRADG
ncbi:thiamine phosphate synthase [Azospirillum picis]|uniref:Thiamine-phosphate pyrophosphorylase n=1 Tax=Azospirillum picis TaxID=488438 RepID=A0ABU0MHN7_9PROT|nr:thiamine phosphate synthase [Azospirillum picis]MBP2298830.1 thiamine-phosphate pyrophosphorylase [Azospirillum picis]MDQ0532928.1 thiamine-phosphate pyrophosphorylase [Azospirillum picis]